MRWDERQSLSFPMGVSTALQRTRFARTFARRAVFSPPYTPPEKTLKLFSHLRMRTLRGRAAKILLPVLPHQRRSGSSRPLLRTSGGHEVRRGTFARSARTLQTARSALLILRPQARFLFPLFLFFKKRNGAAGGRAPRSAAGAVNGKPSQSASLTALPKGEPRGAEKPSGRVIPTKIMI